MTRLHVLLPVGCLLAGLLHGCGGEDPTSPALPVARSVELVPPPITLDAPGHVALQLLGDPLLHLALTSLDDSDGAAAILDAIQAARETFAAGHADAIQRRLATVHDAFDAYVRLPGVDDDDVIHLDAVELFLDEVEALMDPGGRRGTSEKKRN